MAFGIDRQTVRQWKRKIDNGEIAFLTHYWIDERFPGCKTVTKVGCRDLDKLAEWGAQYGLKKAWIDIRKDGYSHFDLLGDKEKEILHKEGLEEQLTPFR
ncbi:hypothetical protein [Falsibacillus pallidus]|uniref:Uncharacterized protein n=1 Tax=Falsibacillus pallidus TaxID=493781 RepID=A0A370GV98_9BACI|nr:hypothetical protein [Falsibacillus pallidus]RDI45843.1 hypothetical protein DFR59_102478 [Falsibacillus pallidus]